MSDDVITLAIGNPQMGREWFISNISDINNSLKKLMICA